MRPRGAVALLLLVAVAASSMEVLIGLESSLADAEARMVLVDGKVEASPDSSGDSEEDCPCLCACICPGAQLVVAPADASTDAAWDVTIPSTAQDQRFPTFPSPQPPLRPPLT